MKLRSVVVQSVLLIVGTLILVSGALSQTPKFRIPIVVTDSAFTDAGVFIKAYRDTVIFGIHPDADYCIDALPLTGFADHWFYTFRDSLYKDVIQEEESPPGNPGFYTWLNNFKNCPGVSTGHMVNIHPYFNSTQRDTFKIKVNVDLVNEPGSKVLLEWPKVLAEYCTGLQIVIPGVGTYDMRTVSSASFVPLNSSTTGSIYLTGPVVPPALPNPPSAVSPPLGDENQDENVTLQWSPVANAHFYRLQVAKDNSAFTGTLLLDTVLTSTTRALTKLKGDSWYYWRVYVSTDYGLSYYPVPPYSFKTKKVALPFPSRIYPDSNRADVPVVPQFRWRKAVSASTPTYRVQIAKDITFSVSSMVKDTSLTDTSLVISSGLQNCERYYWRGNVTNIDGIGDFSTPWNFRTVLNAPAVPVLALPADNAVNVSLTPTLSWSGDLCSDSYRLQVARDNGFINLVADLLVSGTSRQLSALDQDSNYYWRVKSKNTADSSSFSASRTFTTLLQPAATPALVTPANGDTTRQPVDELKWRSVPYAAKYHLQIALDAAFNLLEMNDSTVTDTSKMTLSLSNCATYYWRVRAINRNGSAGYSIARSFTVRTAVPAAPGLISPLNNKDSVQESVTLTWQASDPCTQSFYYHLSLSSSFTDTVQNGTVTGTSVQVAGLVGNKYYYWHVKALNYLGESPFSEIRQFHTTKSTPLAPVLVDPPNNLGDALSCQTFTWDSTTFAEAYRLQVAFDSIFTTLYYNDSTILRQVGVMPSKQVCGLLNSRTYYWRVNAKNDIGTSQWSSVRTFTTLYPPAVPALIEPADNRTGVDLRPQFVWSLATGATRYQLQVLKDTLLSSFVFNDSTLTLASWGLVTQLDGYSEYFWRVRGKNSAGWGNWSGYYSFTTTRIGIGKWLIPLTVAESGSERSTIYFGVNPEATRGIDPGVGEFELPPVPLGYFDVRFVSPYIGEGLLVDYHKFTVYSQRDTFKCLFQPGMGTYPMKFAWDRSKVQNVCDSMVITDRLIAPTVWVRMDVDSSVSINNFSINSLYIISSGAYPVVDVQPEALPVPTGYVLYQNYPNPFNPETKINFSTDQSAQIDVTIYDLLGREVMRLAHGQFIPGVYTFTWNGKNTDGIAMTSGVYYVRMVASGTGENDNPTQQFVSSVKMLMMK